MKPRSESAAAPGAAIRFVDVGGTRLRACVEGSGPPLLLINGIGANLEVWDPLKRLLSGRRLISFDAPGTGLSPAPARPLRMQDLADVVAGLLDELQNDRVDVLGYSFGGALAQQLARQHASRVRRLILAGTNPGLGGVQNPLTVLQMCDPRLHPTHAPERRFDRVSRLVGGRSGSDPAVLAVYERNRLANPPSASGYRLQLRTLLGWSSLPWLHTLRAPTLVLAGENDPIVPAINGRIFTRLIPDCRRHVVPRGGHLFLVDQPEDVVGVIEGFLATTSLPVGAAAPSRMPVLEAPLPLKRWRRIRGALAFRGRSRRARRSRG
jgi:pimeloyl-ACP methyl ester carboxylesterase